MIPKSFEMEVSALKFQKSMVTPPSSNVLTIVIYIQLLLYIFEVLKN